MTPPTSSGTQEKIGAHGAVLGILREDMRVLDAKIDRLLSRSHEFEHTPPCREFLKFETEVRGIVRGILVVCAVISTAIGIAAKALL